MTVEDLPQLIRTIPVPFDGRTAIEGCGRERELGVL